MLKKSDMTADVKAIQTSDTFYAKFKNGGDDDLTVNGSTTPVIFTLEDLPTPDSFLLQRVTFVIGADALVDLDEFGNISALAEGVLFSANEDSPLVAVEAVLQTNGDTLLISTNVNMSTVSFAATDKTVIYGTWDFTESYGGNAPIIIGKDLKITIRDNLSGMDYFKVSCHGILLDNSN